MERAHQVLRLVEEVEHSNDSGPSSDNLGK